MTTILSALTASYVYLLSDRRLVDLQSGKPVVGSNATKSVLFHRSLVIGFTGPAHLPGPDDGALVETGEWIATTVQHCADANEAIDTLRDSLTATYARYRRMLEPAARLDVVAAGWTRPPGGGVIPVRVVISNENEPDPSSFRVTANAFPIDDTTIQWDTHGVGFDARAVAELARCLRRASEHGVGGPRVVVESLVWGFQRFAQRRSWVSTSVLVTTLPLPPEQATEFSIVGGGPNRNTPTAFFVPEGASLRRSVQFFPMAVFPGGTMVRDMRVTQRAPRLGSRAPTQRA